MSVFDFNSRVVSTPTKSEREGIVALIAEQGLMFDEGADQTAVVEDLDGNIVATASLFGNVIRMVAVSPECQEAGLSAVVISNLMEVARVSGISHLFVYTKPEMAGRFASLGFRSIADTSDASLLEIGEPGLGAYKKYLAEAKFCDGEQTCGAIVVNCNPFTKGHRYLIEQASKSCGGLYVIVVEADLSVFAFKDRFAMIELGTADLPNVKLLRSGQYAVSAATFPTYFLKDREKLAVASIQARLDVDLFLRLFVPALGLSVRFVGTEPKDVVTKAYNEAMLSRLPAAGVKVQVLERLKTPAGDAVSASTVRGKLDSGDLSDIADYLPQTTIAYLRDKLSYRL